MAASFESRVTPAAVRPATLRGSHWWLAAGWALHPVWDAGLHYLGPGHSFAPAPYAIACISYDLVVAAYVAFAYGLIGSRRLGFRAAAAR